MNNDTTEIKRDTCTVMEAIEKYLSLFGFKDNAVSLLSSSEQGLLGDYKHKTILQTEIAFVSEFQEQMRDAYINGGMSDAEVDLHIASLIESVYLSVLYDWSQNRITNHIGRNKGKHHTHENVFGFRIGENLDTLAITILLFAELEITEDIMRAAVKMLEPLREKVKEIYIV
ncbi:hypothetical protein P7F88_25160 [Vibrio hannami]|uniref:hypothetical protein n=1 Tax=Vibrio hannami TaxID=2717094 RepID=UPI00240F7D83|nr:hypothetical protein [Vibrio hannami]MDG3089154.1 hypothetical protein [Vibrio hannami]